MTKQAELGIFLYAGEQTLEQGLIAASGAGALAPAPSSIAGEQVGKEPNVELKELVNEGMWSGIMHFKPSEFRHPEHIDPLFLNYLDEVRARVDIPFILTSDGRDPAHNARVGGHPRSLHLFDEATGLRFRAVDFVFPGQTTGRPFRQFRIIAEAALGLGRGRNQAVQLELVHSSKDKHVHLGLKPDRPYEESELIVAAD